MNLKSAAVAFMVGALSLFGAGTSSATDHVAEALKHAQAAVAEGQNDNAKGVAGHARQALTYAEMGEKLKSDPHITEAKTHLNQAIEHGDMGHAKVAGEHAQLGVDHLKMAYKEEETQ